MEKELYSFFLRGDEEKAIYLLIILLAIWLFKEIRNRYLQTEDSKVARFDIILEAYGSLEVSIVLYLKEQNETNAKNLYENISKSYPAFSRNIHKLVTGFLETHEDDKLNEILHELRKELSELKYEQSQKSYQLHHARGYLGYFWSHFKTFCVPIFITLVTVVVILFAILFLYDFLTPEQSWMTRINLLALIFSSGFLFVFAVTFVDLLMAKKLTHGWKSWSSLTGFIATVILLLYFKLPVVSAAVIVLFSTVIMPKLLKRG